MWLRKTIGVSTCEWDDRERKTYFIEGHHTPLVKIGSSKNPAGRLRDMLVASPVTLSVVAYLPGPCRERELHHTFRPQRSHGEWFKVNQDLANLMARSLRIAMSDEMPPKHYGEIAASIPRFDGQHLYRVVEQVKIPHNWIRIARLESGRMTGFGECFDQSWPASIRGLL